MVGNLEEIPLFSGSRGVTADTSPEELRGLDQVGIFCGIRDGGGIGHSDAILGRRSGRRERRRGWSWGWKRFLTINVNRLIFYIDWRIRNTARASRNSLRMIDYIRRLD